MEFSMSKNDTLLGEVQTSPTDPLGTQATELAANAMFGHLGVTITASYEAAIAGEAEYYLVHCYHPGDKKGGRYWSLSLVRNADIPTLIDKKHSERVNEARVNGGIIPTRDDTVESFKRFHTGVTKNWLAWTVGAVVEIDHLPRAEQERLYAQLEVETGLRWALKTFSGGKSVHALLSFDRLVEPTDPIREEVQHLLIAILDGDPAIEDPGRLTRLPGWVDPEGRREQPVVHLDNTAHFAPEDIRDRLRAYAVRLGQRDLQTSVDALKVAKRLDDAARAPRTTTDPHIAPQDALDLVQKLHDTRFDPNPEDVELAKTGASILRLAARVHSAAEKASGYADLEMREHADLLRETWQCVDDDDLSLAYAMLGKFDPHPYVSGAGSGTTHNGVYRVPLTELEPFKKEARGTRVVPPCCGLGGSGRTDGAAQVMSAPGESPRLWCHRCAHVVMAEVEPIVYGFRALELTSPGYTTPLNKEQESGVTGTTLIKVNEKRLTDAIPAPLGLVGDEGGILLIRSPQETGKTHLGDLIAKECKQRWPGEAQVAPTHRVALVRNLAGRLGYETYDVDPRAQCVATTLDSIGRIPTYTVNDDGMLNDRQFSFVFLDEVSQLLRHAVGGTIGADAPMVISKLKNIIAQARYIIAADADADDNVVEILRMLAPTRKVVVVDNEWRPDDRGACLYADRNDHLHDFIEDVKGGLKVAYFTCGGPKRAATVAEMVKEARNDVMCRVYSSDTSKLPEVQDELAEINEATAKYAVLVATPTLGSGVDIQDPDFDRVYLDVPSHDVGADEAVQLGFRVRNPKDRVWRVWVDHRRRSREVYPTRIRSELLDIRRQTEGAIAKRYNNSPVIRQVTATELAPVDALHLNLYCRARAHVHRQTNGLRRAMQARLEEAGFTLTEKKGGNPSAIKATREAKKEAKETVVLERAKRIVAAKDITIEEARLIKRARRASQEEFDASEKSHISHFYGAEPDVELVLEDDRGKLRPKISLLAIYLLARDGAHKEALVRDVQGVNKGLTALLRGKYIAAIVLKALLKLYGVAGELEEYQEQIKPVPDFAQQVKSLLPLLWRYLRIKPRPKTKTVGGKKVRLADIDHIDLLSRTMGKFGLKLNGVPTKVDGKTVRVYIIDTELACHRIELAEAAGNRLKQALLELEKAGEQGRWTLADEDIDLREMFGKVEPAEPHDLAACSC